MKIDIDFAIFGMQRSGTHMLAHALDSHPQLTFHCELEDFIRYHRQYEKMPETRNFAIVMYNQLHLAEKFCIDLPAIPLIHLTRNERDLAISCVRNNKSKAELKEKHRPHFTDATEIPVQMRYTPNEAEIEDWVGRIREWKQAALAKISAHAQLMVIDYQEITLGRDIRCIEAGLAKKLCSFLGVTPAPLTIDIVRSG